MAFGIKITLTHSGTTTTDVIIYPPYITVPLGGSIELLFDDVISRSYETGSIRQAITDLTVTASFNVGDTFTDAVGGGGGFVSGWTTFSDSDPTEGSFPGIGMGDRGYLIRGASNNSKMAFYFDDSTDKLYIKGATSATGPDVYVEAGHSSASNGGKVRLYGGDALNGSGGHGGYVRLRGGYADTASIGGYVELQGGSSGQGVGGYINLDAGQGATTGGDINLNAGYGNQTGGAILIHGGQGGNLNGGNVTIEGGYAGGPGNISGVINISSGEIGGGGGATVGSVNLFTPNADNDGYSGSINLTAGSSGPTLVTSGGRSGGYITLTAGDSNSDAGGSNGGHINLYAGNGSNIIGEGGNGSGGDISIIAGVAPVTGEGGSIQITSGGSADGNGGDITLSTGTGVNGISRSGNIILDPAGANLGATAGEVIIYNTVKLGNYTTNGLLTTSSGNGTIASPIKYAYGREEVTITAGSGFQNVFITNSNLTATNTVVVTFEASDAGFYDTATKPTTYVTGRNLVTNEFTVRIDYALSGGVNKTAYVNYWIIG